MKKTPSAFLRDLADLSRLSRTPNPECAWLFAPDAPRTVRATRKWDGTCCLVRDGKLFARYDAKHGKVPPDNFEPAQPEPDPITGHWPGWIPVLDQPHLKWHREAWRRLPGILTDGTYELCGPSVSANPDGFERNTFVRHGEAGWDVPMFFVTYETCEERLADLPWEGIVFHHTSGAVAKIKRCDFGLPWPVKK